MTPRQKRIEELGEQINAVRAEMLDLEQIEADNLTDEQTARMEVIPSEFDTLTAERDRLVEAEAAAERIRAAAEIPTNRTSGFSAPNVHVQRDDMFDNLDAVRAGMVDGMELRDRALRGIEATSSRGMSERADEAARKVEMNEGAARLALLTGSPAYRSAFEKVIRYPETFQGMFTGEEQAAFRTAMSTTSGNGGYAIPFLLDPSVVLSSSGSTNPFRQVARVETGTSNKWNGVSSAGVTAYWKGEGSAFTDGSPTLAQPSVTAYLGSAYVLGSYEVFEDTNLAAQLPVLIQDAKDILEADAFAVGSGSTAPFGVVTSTTAVTTSRVTPTTGGTFTSASLADVYKVVNALQPRWRSNSTWLANYATYNIIRRMGEGVTGQTSHWESGLQAGQPDRLLGLPVIEGSAVVSTVTTGSNILLCGDFRQFLIYDRLGTSIEYIPNVVDGSGIPTGQRGWVAHWRTGSDVLVPNAFRVLKL